MKTNHVSRLWAATLVGLFLASCSTVDTRIRHNPELFNALPPEQQSLIKAGRVALGFESTAVKLALGEPDRVTTRLDADGESVTWHYVTYEADGHSLYTGYYHYGRGGWWGWGGYPYYTDYPHRTVRDRFRVEFKRDRVTAITKDVAA